MTASSSAAIFRRKSLIEKQYVIWCCAAELLLGHQRCWYWLQYINEPWPQQPSLRDCPIVLLPCRPVSTGKSAAGTLRSTTMISHSHRSVTG